MSSTNPISLSLEDARTLSIAILERAFADMHGQEHDDPIEVLSWLASTRAEPHFDLLGIPQSTALIHSGWMELAEEALWDPFGAPEEVDDAQIECIITTYNYLRSLGRSTG